MAWNGRAAMRIRLGLTGLALAACLGAGRAHADCACPAASLDERIESAAVIFSGKPLMSAQIPTGSSPFHSEQSIEQPGGLQYDTITLFQVDTVWKGKPVQRIKVRHERDDCAADFHADVPVIVFAVADPAGILWTRACSGTAVSGEDGYDALKQSLTNRLRYN
jgi:hypothetical protein